VNRCGDDVKTGSRTSTRRRRGVTLLELVAVVLIIGIVASVSAVGFRRSLGNARKRQAVEAFLFFDQQCRTLADRSNREVRLRYHADDQTLQRDSSGSLRSTMLATDVNLSKLWVAGTEDDVSTVRFFAGGSSDTYALIDGNDRCVLVLGATGQVVNISSLADAKELVDGVQHTTRSVTD